MTSASSQPAEKSASDGTKSSLLSTSARGATLLIGLQVGSRALTFIVNQILLRYLSPARLGVSTQLEVYSISVLFFARESLRVAIQRQADTEDGDSRVDGERRVPEGHVDGSTAAGRSQAIVNLAYISVYLGIVFAVVLAWLYLSTLRSADPVILETPYFQESLKLYGFAAVWELLAEPFFVVVQQKSRFKIRATAEAIATLLRCLMTCGSAVWAARGGRDLGVLPFALGQCMYAVALLLVYYWSVSGIASGAGFSLMPAQIYSRYPIHRHLVNVS
jgi:oligosaccharide translocation protein RFT1